MRASHITFALILGCLFVGCSKPPAPGKTPNSGTAKQEEEWHGSLHGDPQPLGEMKLGPHTLSVTQLGELDADGGPSFDISPELPGTVRAWIGIESGVGSRRGKLYAENGKLHGHVEVPAELAAAAMLWLELETDTGKLTGSIALHR